MTVIAFSPRLPRRNGFWRTGELAAMVETVAAARSQAHSWELGATEIGDPQFYLLGPPPHEECILCISRLGGVYVLEDGAGRVLFEHNSLALLAEQARSILQKKKGRIVARAALIWYAVRETLAEKLEAVMGEGEELLAHVVPQIAALA
jgi:hypothetical protein